MKKALENIRAAVLAGNMSITDAAQECRKNGFSLDYPGGVRYLLNLPAAADRSRLVHSLLDRAEKIVRHYWSDTEIDKQIINSDDFCGVYAWAARECGTCFVRIGLPGGLPDEKGIEFFRACCANWRGLRWYVIDAQGYSVHIYESKNPADGEMLINDRIAEMYELAQERAERAAMCAELAAAM